MRVGTVREIKPDEYRVALTPAGAYELVRHGHEVFIEKGAGEGSSFTDEDYTKAGAVIADRQTVWEKADLLLKVKEPVEDEPDLLRPDQTLFTYLHLAPNPELTNRLIGSNAVCIAYETVETDDGRTPLLAPMSEVAGRLAPQVGAGFLERPNGGRGVLLGGVAGVKPAKVVILGGGIAGQNAARIALGLGANCTILDINIDRLRDLEDIFSGRMNLVHSSAYAILDLISDADLVIGAVLVPGAKAPSLVTRDMLSHMQDRSVIVDVAIDQGGCIETAKPTTHKDPVYVVDDVIHYCVTNMPGAVPYTSTQALTNATLPYILRMADMGINDALASDHVLARGANVMNGHITNRAVGDALGMEWTTVDTALTEMIQTA